MSQPSASPTPTAPPDAVTPRPCSRGRRIAVWAAGLLLALVLLLAALLLGAWWWAGSSGSLATTLSWAQRWSEGRADTVGRLQVTGVSGSLRRGGRLAEVRWTRTGLDVHAQGVALALPEAFWWDALQGRGVHVPLLALDALAVDDTRAATPTEALTALPLPLPLSAGFALQRFSLSGKTSLTLAELQGTYAYGRLLSASAEQAQQWPALAPATGVTHSHRLHVTQLSLADGRYSAQVQLGAQAPMPLAAVVHASVRTPLPQAEAVSLRVQARAQGRLGGTDASLAVDAQVQETNTARAKPAVLAVQARLQPWAPHVLAQADIRAEGLNLAGFWPQAPQTALSGQVSVQPEGEAWRALFNVRNTRVGPADQGGLPVQQLRAQLTQQADSWTLSQLQLLVAGGTVQGQGQLRLTMGEDGARLGAWQGQIDVQGLQAQALWSSLTPATLQGALSARTLPQRGGADALSLDAQLQATLREASGDAAPRLRLQAEWQAHTPSSTHGVLTLREAQLSLAQTQWDAQGRWDSAAQSYDGWVKLEVPGARAQAQGLWAASAGQGDLQLQVDDGARGLAWLRQLQTLPAVGPALRQALAGQARLALQGQAQLQAGWKGGLAAWGWPMPAGTTAQASAKLAAPVVHAELTVPHWHVQSDATAPAITVQATRLSADGPLHALRLQTDAQVALAQGVARWRSQGEWRANQPAQAGVLALDALSVQWQATAASGQRAERWVLDSPQALKLQWSRAAKGLVVDAGAGRLLLRDDEAANAGKAPVQLDWQRLLWQAQGLETQGQVQGLSWPWLQALAALGQVPQAGGARGDSGLDGDLLLQGQWALQWPAGRGAPPEVSVTVQRQSGDLRWTPAGAAAAEPLAAGIQDARVSITVQQGQAQARLRWDSARLGQVEANVRASLAKTPADNAGWASWLPPSTPLQGQASLRLPELGIGARFSPPGWRVRGKLDGQFALSGTLAQPQWQGQLSADDLALQSVVDGIAFTQGQLRATLSGDRIEVQRFSLQGAGGRAVGGQIEAKGHAEWSILPGSAKRQPVVQLQATADRLRISSRVDRRLTVSGTLNADLQADVLKVRGQLLADAAQIVLPDELAPSLGPDVVVRGTRPMTEDSAGTKIKPDVEIRFDFGPKFAVRGQGIDTRLAGQVTVRATPDLPAPRALGEVRTVAGSYRAYGQTLNIETGILRFTGPLDDPSLDILALRKLPSDAEQRVGVQVSGSAQTPVAALYAEPELPNVDKLAWLVLGRPASAAGAQAFVLQQAAQNLLARNGQSSGQGLAQAFQLDALGLMDHVDATDPEATQTALVLGKRLSDKLYVSYEQTLSGTMSTVSILYNLSRRFTLRARAGTENAMDLIFTLQYQ